MTNSRLMDLVFRLSENRADALDRNDEMLLSILAGETVTVFGRRMEVTLAWPDGMPMNLSNDTELRALAADWLSQVRQRRIARTSQAERQAP